MLLLLLFVLQLLLAEIAATQLLAAAVERDPNKEANV